MCRMAMILGKHEPLCIFGHFSEVKETAFEKFTEKFSTKAPAPSQKRIDKST